MIPIVTLAVALLLGGLAARPAMAGSVPGINYAYQDSQGRYPLADSVNALAKKKLGRAWDLYDGVLPLDAGHVGHLALLSLAGRVDPDPATVLALRAVGQGSAFVHAYDTRGTRTWYSLAYANQDSLVWGREGVELVMKDGSIVPALEMYAVSEEARLLTLHGCRFARDEVKRKRFRRGDVCSVLFAGFRFGIDPDSVATVRIAPPPSPRTSSRVP